MYRRWTDIVTSSALPVVVCRGGATTPKAWTSAPQRGVLLIEGWDSEEEGSGGHWVGVTHDGLPPRGAGP